MPRTFIARFQTIDRLIQKKATGNAQQLAQKIGVSRRTIIEFIAIMKEMGAPVYFDKGRNSYLYKEQGHFNISFVRGQ